MRNKKNHLPKKENVEILHNQRHEDLSFSHDVYEEFKLVFTTVFNQTLNDVVLDEMAIERFSNFFLHIINEPSI